jgi:hypothetical protein
VENIMKKAAIIQSNYLPWKGYFDIIHDVDIFVFLEDVQYTKNDWRNRNKIKTPKGTEWITVPVIGGIHQKIYETRIDNSKKWMKKHRKTIHANYASAKFYDTYKEDILDIYNKEFDTISELNIYAIKEICKILDINTKFVNSKNLKAPGKKDTRVINICKEIGADYYLSGPAAKDYIDKEKFEKADIKLEYKKYGGYPEYKQLWDGFTHYVSIIDLIFNCGEKSPYYIWG